MEYNQNKNKFVFKYKTNYANVKIIDIRKKCRKSFNDLTLCTLNNILKIMTFSVI